jgi:hypothetical protein
MGYDSECVCCIVAVYRNAGNTDCLEEYIFYKEVVSKSISEYVMEVLG